MEKLARNVPEAAPGWMLRPSQPRVDNLPNAAAITTKRKKTREKREKKIT